MIGSKESNTSNNIDIYDTFKYFYLSEKKTWKAVSRNAISERFKSSSRRIKRLMVRQQKLQPKKMQLNRLLVSFSIPLDFEIFKHSVDLYGL